MGRFLMEGILARDIPVVQGAGLLIGFSYVAVNMTVDVLCVALSPSRNAGETSP
jgi:peptide/nickel transport system permease protein